MTDEITIKPADAAWPGLFAAEAALLRAALGAHFAAIEHVGSTAVLGLDAKPVIDILGGVRSMAEADALLGPLCRLGWDTSPAFNAGLADRRFLLRWPGGVRTHHLHLVVHGGETWGQHLTFRDRLRAHPDLAEQYQELKYRLAAEHRADREAYTAAKSKFIGRVIGLPEPGPPPLEDT